MIKKKTNYTDQETRSHKVRLLCHNHKLLIDLRQNESKRYLISSPVINIYLSAISSAVINIYLSAIYVCWSLQTGFRREPGIKHEVTSPSEEDLWTEVPRFLG